MHKGYTLNYFIEFFKSIPDHQWCEGTEQESGTVRHCALGHARRDNRTTLSETANPKTSRVEALKGFIGDVAGINDAQPGDYFYELGATPRGRILKALRNRKRTGDVFGNENN